MTKWKPQTLLGILYMLPSCLPFFPRLLHDINDYACDIIFLQETKCASFDEPFIRSFALNVLTNLPSFLPLATQMGAHLNTQYCRWILFNIYVPCYLACKHVFLE
jgi:hypothetical protein